MSQQIVNAETLCTAISTHNIMTGMGYLQTVNEGVSGKALQRVIKLVDDHDVFAKVTGKDKSNLSKSYRVKALPRMVADNVVDTTRIYIQAINVFGDFTLANEWLHAILPILGGQKPVDIIDTQAGRTLIRDALKKIEWGEYS